MVAHFGGADWEWLHGEGPRDDWRWPLRLRLGLSRNRLNMLGFCRNWRAFSRNWLAISRNWLGLSGNRFDRRSLDGSPRDAHSLVGDWLDRCPLRPDKRGGN